MPSEFELKILADNMGALINAERKTRGLRELHAVPYLNECAEIRSEEASISYSHTRPNGEYCSDVIDYNKFKYGYFAENLAAGLSDVKTIFNQWRNSSQNWAAITNTDITHMGIGVFYSPNSEYQWYWCTIFTNDLNGEIEHEGQYLPKEIDLNRKISVISKDENGEVMPDCDIVLSSENGTLEFVKLEKNNDSFTDFTISTDKKNIAFKSDEVSVTILNIPTETYYDYSVRSSKSGYKSEKISFMMSADGTVLNKTGIEETDRNFIFEMKPQKLHIMFYAEDYGGSSLIIESSGDLSEVESVINFSLSADKKTLSFTPAGQENIFEKLPHGSYKLYAQNVPEGYKLPDRLSFSITEGTAEDVYQSMSLSAIYAYFYCYGTDENSQQILISGAEFTLTNLDGKSLDNITSNNTELNTENNSVSWISGNYTMLSRLPTGDYQLTENIPPDGYSTAQTITFSIDSKGNVNNLINAVAVGTFGIKILHSKPVLKSIYQPDYITIYDCHTKQNQFETHGLGVLIPTKAEITEYLNGKYELSIEHPIDTYGKWRYISENNIIKALGQLFTIKIVIYDWKGSTGKIIANAEHIFYQLNDWWIFPDAGKLTITGGSSVKTLAYLAIDYLSSKMIAAGQTYYNFSCESDMILPESYGERIYDISNGCTPVKFVMDSGGLLELSKGEIYRDNFYFSIYEHIENYNDNAFEIRIGKNLKGIKRTVDITTMCTYFLGYDNYGNIFGVSWHENSVLIAGPHSVIRSKNFFYSFDNSLQWSDFQKADAAAKMLETDVFTFFEKYCYPLISFEVDLEDVQNNLDFIEFNNKPKYKVGNIGTIYDERLGGEIRLKITKTVKDAITGKTIRVCFGDIRSFTNNNGYKSAVLDLKPVVYSKVFQIMDASGAFICDSAGYIIVQNEV